MRAPARERERQRAARTTTSKILSSRGGSVIHSNAERGATLVDLCALRFDNRFVRELPAHPLLRNVSRAVRSPCYTRVDPTPVQSPQLRAWAGAVGEMLAISPPDSPAGPVAEVLGGNR